jgi:putative beta-barrel porin BBP2
MRTFIAHTGALAFFAACLFVTGIARGEGEVIGGSTPEAPAPATDSGSPSGSDIGVGNFSRFPLNISASIHGGYDDNVSTSSAGKQGSWFTTLGLVAGYQLGNARTKLTLSSSFGFTYYGSVEDNSLEPNLNLSMTLIHHVTPRLSLEFAGSAAYQTEPDFQYGLSTNRRAGNYFFTTDKLSANYAWAPRFATATSYSIAAIKYDDSAAGMFEDRIENTFGNEFRFLLWPTTNLIGEYRFQIVNYDQINRDSTTNYLLGGFDHTFGPRLSAVFRGGAQFRSYEDGSDQNSPYFESSLSYKLGKDTSVVWESRYGIEEGDLVTNSTRKTFRTGIQGRHNLTSRISANLAMYFSNDDYEETRTLDPATGKFVTNPSFTENSFNVDLSLRYLVTRYMGIDVGYDHTTVSSGAMSRDYSRNRVWGGVNVSF